MKLNEPSKRAAVRLGYRYEGRFRHHMVTKGRNRDTDWFSVTDACGGSAMGTSLIVPTV